MRVIYFIIGIFVIIVGILFLNIYFPFLFKPYIYFHSLLDAFVPHFTGMIIVGISFLLFIIFLPIIIRDFFNLEREREILRQIKTEVKNINLQDIDIISKLQDIVHKKKDSKNKKVVEIIEKIIKIRELDSIELSNMLEKLLFRFDFLVIRKGLPNIFLLLGILGTIIGLSEAVYNLSVQVSSIGNNVISPKDFYPLLAGTIESMKNAFACSLWGILFSIFSYIIIRLYSKELNKFLNEFREFILFDLSEIVFPKKIAIEFENVSKVIKISQKLLDRFKEYLNEISSIMKQSAIDFNNALKDNILAIKDMIDNLIGTTNIVKETLNDTTKNVTKSLGDSVEAISNASQELKKGLVDIRETTQNLRKYYDDLNRIYFKLEENIEKQLKEIKVYEKTIEEKTREIINKLMDVSENLNDTQLKFKDYSKEINDSIKEIRDYIQSPFDDLKDNLIELLTKYYNQIDNLINTFKNYSKDVFQELQYKNNRIIDDFTKFWEDFKNYKESLTKYYTQVDNLINTFKSQTEDLINTFKSYSQDVKQDGKSNIPSTNLLLDNYNVVGTEMLNHLNKIKESFENLTQNINELNTNIKKLNLASSEIKDIDISTLSKDLFTTNEEFKSFILQLNDNLIKVSDNLNKIYIILKYIYDF